MLGVCDKSEKWLHFSDVKKIIFWVLVVVSFPLIQVVVLIGLCNINLLGSSFRP